ncbi:MAG: NAD(P)/FAD-dependent oxidoreductase [Spirochaetia bacterium]
MNQNQSRRPIEADVAIIGAGVSGAAIARQLSRYKLDVVLLEKEIDVSFGTSKANSGIIHGGFHHPPGKLKTALEVQGNIMFDQLQRELDFPFKRCGIIVAAFNEEEMKTIQRLYSQGIENGSIGIEMCSRDRILDLEPKLSKDVAGGLFAPSGGIIEPYRFVYSLVESAIHNGVQLVTNFEVAEANHEKNEYIIKSSHGEEVHATYVINAAGLFADEISKIFGAEEFTITPRKGEYYLLDRASKACPSRIIFPTPSRVSKGQLIIPTVEGTVLIGPTADEVESKINVDTEESNLKMILHNAQRIIQEVSPRDIITAFAGLRPALDSGDFFIDISHKAPHFIQVSGIQSPGLTAAPAIGDYVKDLLKKSGCILTEKNNFDPFVEKVPRIKDADPMEADELIKNDPLYGEIVCRCEMISEAEIVHAVKRGHITLDGVKFFTRAQMGRCQGGFCTHKILQIIQRETGLPLEEITKRGRESYVVKKRVGDYKIDSYQEAK